MKQTRVKLQTTDDKSVYGIYDFIGSDTLVIMLHGFASKANNHLFYELAKNLNTQGIDSFRISFYASDSDARDIESTSFTEYSSDLKVVLDYFRDKYQRIFLIGHSLGGAVAILNHHIFPFAGIILYDPTLMPSIPQASFHFNSSLNLYQRSSGQLYFMSPELFKQFGELNVLTPLKHIDKPTSIFFASQGNYHTFQSEIQSVQNPNLTTQIIANSNHKFDSFENVDEIIKKLPLSLSFHSV